MNTAYFTPVDTTLKLLDSLRKTIDQEMRILEPCAGEGQIVRALHWRNIVNVVAIESNPKHIMQLCCVAGRDNTYNATFFAKDLLKEIGLFDWIIMNPPYNQIEEFIAHSHDFLMDTGKLAALLCLGHLVGIKRGKFLKKYKPTIINLLCHRPTFLGPEDNEVNNNGQFNGGYAWVIWEKNRDANADTIVRWLD